MQTGKMPDSALYLVAWRVRVSLVGFMKMQQTLVSCSLAIRERCGLIKASRSKTDCRIRQFALGDHGRTHYENTLSLVSAYGQSLHHVLTNGELALFLVKVDLEHYTPRLIFGCYEVYAGLPLASVAIGILAIIRR